MNPIALDKATIAAGDKIVLSDVCLTIASGEFVGVLGANGAGKTTLMRAILGLIRPLAGSITVLGRPARRANADIGYLPQTRVASPNLRLSAYDFLASCVRGNRWGLPYSGSAGRAEIARVVDLVSGGDLVDRPLSTLSGGERQRLLLAQALIGSPRLLLLDEPLISLDPRQQDVVVRLARSLCDRLGLTVLFTAHELNQVLPAIDRVLYLGSGQAAIGTVDEVVTPEVMSRIYGARIDVVHIRGRIFVLSEGRDGEHRPHGGHDDNSDRHNHPRGQADDLHVRL